MIKPFPNSSITKKPDENMGKGKGNHKAICIINKGETIVEIKGSLKTAKDALYKLNESFH